MDRRCLLVVLALLFVALTGCGEPAEKSSIEPSKAPHAVAGESGAAIEDDGSEDAQIRVEGAGFTIGTSGTAGFGLVLQNTSTTRDAFDVAMTVNLLDKSGNAVDTDNRTLSLIPAGETSYYGGEIYEPGEATKLEAFADVGHWDAAEYELPQATNVRAVKESWWTGTAVKGQVENTHDAALSSLAYIGCVLFDKNDKVVGGGFAFLDADLPSGSTAAFDATNGVMDTAHDKVAKAKCSVESVFDTGE